ncbi:MAG: hypothetical protein JSW48_10990 [Betaproteobacteria bacterium]|nr:MAG: hypothetical protein JSW48_10990 [Betaproteobacteria bacterium]
MNSESRIEILQNSVRRLLVTNTVENARALLRRFQEVDSFNAYVHERMPPVLLAMLIMFLISLACVTGIVTLLPDMHSALILPMLLILPVVLAGSFLIQIYVFFSWLEGRSMERSLAPRRKAPRGVLANWVRSKLNLDLGPVPAVPWLPAAILLFMPLLTLTYSWRGAAMTFIALGILMPIAYAWVDR